MRVFGAYLFGAEYAPNRYNSLQSILHYPVSSDAFFSAEYCTRRNNSLGVANYLRIAAPKMTSLGVVDRKKDVIFRNFNNSDSGLSTQLKNEVMRSS